MPRSAGPSPPFSGERVKTLSIFRAPLEGPPASQVAEPPAAVLLRLGHPRLPVLRRFLAPGPGGRHIVDLCRTADPRIRLVARRAVGGGVVGRGAGGADLAADRSAGRPVRLARSAVSRGARDGGGDDAAVADPVAARLLLAVLHCPDGLGRSVRARDLWRC